MELTKLDDTQDVPPGLSLFEIMGKEGDTKYIWDKNNPDEVEIAKTTFEAFKAKNYLIFRVIDKDGAKGEQTREFDPNAERYIFSPQMQGG